MPHSRPSKMRRSSRAAQSVSTSNDLDGCVILQAFNEAHVAANPPRLDRAARDAEGERGALTEAEEEMIEEKLRALGYL